MVGAAGFGSQLCARRWSQLSIRLPESGAALICQLIADNRSLPEDTGSQEKQSKDSPVTQKEYGQKSFGNTSLLNKHRNEVNLLTTIKF